MAEHSSKNIMIIAHRGCSSSSPENTMAAIREALAAGVDIIEIDVHQSMDGYIILMHDKTLRRTAGKRKKIKDLSLKELQKHEVGSWFHKNFNGERIPLLEDVLKTVNGKAKLLIEVKQGSRYYPGIEENIIALIKKYQAQEWCIIQSFKNEVLKKIKALDKSIEIHKLVRGNIGILPLHIDLNIKPGRIEKYTGVDGINIHHKHLNKKVVAHIKSRNQKVFTWTVNKTSDMKKAVKLGVSGIITNYPEKLKEVLKKN